MKADIAEEMALVHSMYRNIKRADESLLKSMGAKTREGALWSAMEYAERKIKAHEAAFLKKWPDR
jgi:hypothetical protein